MVSGLITLLMASAALSPESIGSSLARSERKHGIETPVRSNGPTSTILLNGSRIVSFWPSGRTPTRPPSLTALMTTPSLPLSSGFVARPSMRTSVPTSKSSSAGPVAGASAAMPCHSTWLTCAQRGAACTASIHSSRLAIHMGEPTSQPMAVPADTMTRSFSEPVITWKPSSFVVTRELMANGKPPSSLLISHAAQKTPPGGAVGTSSRRVLTSNGLVLGSSAALRYSSSSSRPTVASRSPPSDSTEAIRRSRNPESSAGAQKAMPPTATAARISCGVMMRLTRSGTTLLGEARTSAIGRGSDTLSLLDTSVSFCLHSCM